MQVEERDEERDADYHEEWQAGNDGYLPYLQYEDVQDRQVVDPGIRKKSYPKGVAISYDGMLPPALCVGREYDGIGMED